MVMERYKEKSGGGGGSSGDESWESVPKPPMDQNEMTRGLKKR